MSAFVCHIENEAQMQKRITIRISDATAGKLAEVAKAREVKIAHIIRAALREYLWPHAGKRIAA